MSIKKILCATDFSPGAEQALRVAVRLAKDTASELVVVHSTYLPAPAFSGDYPYPAALLQDIVSESKKLLDAEVEKARGFGAPNVRAEQVMGVPWVGIVDLVERQGFDLCVIGTHGRTGLSRVLLGSVAEKVVRHSPCSVITVKPDAQDRPFSRALIPVDFSPSAKYAVELATKLVDAPGTITLLHVLELPSRFSGEVPAPAFDEEMNRRAAEALKEEAAALAKITPHKIETRLRIGYAGHEILQVLDEDPSYDLIAMGSRGRTGIKRVLLGSVAEKTVRHAQCPVLVARVPLSAMTP